MEEILNFFGSPAGKILAASSVVAALVTSIVSLVNVKMTNRRLLDVETARQVGEISSSRYTKLYELMNEFNAVSAVNHDLSDTKKLVETTTERFHQVERIFERAESLLEDSHTSDALKLKLEAEYLSNKMVEMLYADGEEVSLKELLIKRRDFDQAVKIAISSSIKALTNSSTGKNTRCARIFPVS